MSARDHPEEEEDSQAISVNEEARTRGLEDSLVDLCPRRRRHLRRRHLACPVGVVPSLSRRQEVRHNLLATGRVAHQHDGRLAWVGQSRQEGKARTSMPRKVSNP